MTERPILFQGAMVRALLAGTKTQTRRAVKGLHPDCRSVRCESGIDWKFYDEFDRLTQATRCPYGQDGDRLWVRESWMDVSGTGVEARDPHTLQRTRYAFMADTPAGSYADQCRKDYGLKWRPSIHMPRAACRIVLEITDVRVERLNHISEADAMAEGIVPCKPEGWHTEDGRHFHARDPRISYAALWEAINGAGSWNANPWVWAVSFRRADEAAMAGDACKGAKP